MFYERWTARPPNISLDASISTAPTSPTGLHRTYPNLLTREGVMGMEYCQVE